MTSKALPRRKVAARLSEADNLSGRVYQALKADILKCELHPGLPVNESALARRYAVSRTPVREALNRLMQDGLIRSGLDGYTIAPITMRDVHDVYRLRIILERESAEAATPRISAAALDDLERQLDDLGRIILEADSDADQRLAYASANQDFHITVANASGNARLARMIAGLLEEASRYVYIESSQVGQLGVEESLRVVQAMRQRDASAARAAMDAHLRATYERALSALAYSSDSWLPIAER